ncbi:MAG TPA: hypothetical protein VKY85_01285 [Candidatus Angelobacter sp.]|nr:hypothetical protein [Candidatus Angelobacter sp.]
MPPPIILVPVLLAGMAYVGVNKVIHKGKAVIVAIHHHTSKPVAHAVAHPKATAKAVVKHQTAK